jgi:acyl-CoA thioesterase FadM
VYVYFRLLWVIIAGLLAPRRSVLDESRLTFRVWPNDLDFNLHMNNGRYLTLMDLGRVDLMVRAGLLPYIRREKWQPMLGSCTIRFRRGLAPFERYTLSTRILCWDEKWVYMLQRFEQQNGKVAALALVRGLFTSPHGSLKPAEVLKVLGITATSPQMPVSVSEWIDADERLWGENVRPTG